MMDTYRRTTQPQQTVAMKRERKIERRCLLLMLAAFLATAWLDDPELHDPKPGPNAPAFYDFRNDRWVQP